MIFYIKEYINYKSIIKNFVNENIIIVKKLELKKFLAN